MRKRKKEKQKRDGEDLERGGSVEERRKKGQKN